MVDLVDVWLRTLGTPTTEEEELRGLKTGPSTPLPVNFCYPFFNKAVSMLLVSEHYQILLKGLTFMCAPHSLPVSSTSSVSLLTCDGDVLW